MRALLRPDGVCFASAAGDVEGVRCCDAAGAARALGFPRGGNLVLLGYAAAVLPGLLPSAEAILATLDRLSPDPAREANRQAFGRGAEMAW